MQERKPVVRRAKAFVRWAVDRLSEARTQVVLVVNEDGLVEAYPIQNGRK